MPFPPAGPNPPAPVPPPSIPQLRRFPGRAFNQQVTFASEGYSPLSTQGGANPVGTIATGTYLASVQDAKSKPVEKTAGGVESPRSVTTYRIFIDFDPADTLLPTMKVGDQVTWNGLVLTVTSTGNNRGGQSVLWAFDCEAIP